MSLQSTGTSIKKINTLDKIIINTPRKQSGYGRPKSHSRRSSRRHLFDKKEDPQKKICNIRRNLMFKVKAFLAFLKAKETIENYFEFISPGFRKARKALQNNVKSYEDAKCVYNFIKNFTFFQRFVSEFCDVDEKALIELCKCTRYESYSPGNFVFQEGDPSNDRFYVIFKGSVSVIKSHTEKLNHNKEDLEYWDSIKQEATNPSQEEALQSGRTLNSTDSIETLKLQKIRTHKHSCFRFPKELYLDKLAHKLEKIISATGTKQEDIGVGESFGETALVDSHAPRPFSVLTNTNCEFLIINRRDYVNIVTKYDQKRRIKKEFMENKIPFLDSIASLDVWNVLYNSLEGAEYTRGSIISIEDTKGKKLYFIRNGECDLEKTIEVPIKNNKNNNETLKVKRVLVTLGSGSCMGEEILLNDNPVYKYTIKVKSSNAYLYSIDKSILLSNFPKQCVASLKENFSIKEELHVKKIKRIVQEYIEEANNDKGSRNDIKLNNDLPFVSLFSPKIYRHVHVAQPKMAEKVDELLKNSREGSPFDKDNFCLFSKQDYIPKKVRPKFLEVYQNQKKMLMEALKSPRAKEESQAFSDFNLANPHVFLQKTKSQKETPKGLKKSKVNEKKNEPTFPSLKSLNQSILPNDLRTSLTTKQLTTISNRQTTEESSNYFLQTIRISNTRQGPDTEENLNTIEYSGLASPKPSFYKIQRKNNLTLSVGNSLALRPNKYSLTRNNSPGDNQSNDSMNKIELIPDNQMVTSNNKPIVSSSLAINALKALTNYSPAIKTPTRSFMKLTKRNFSCLSSPKFTETGEVINNPLLLTKSSSALNVKQVGEALSPKLFYISSKKNFNNALSNHNNFLEIKGKVNSTLNSIKQRKKVMAKSISMNISPNTSVMYAKDVPNKVRFVGSKPKNK